MDFWLITTIRVRLEGTLHASAIQNLRTAAALAEAGHRVLVWVAELEVVWEPWFKRTFGAAPPAGLRVMLYDPRGQTGDKKTPFSSPWACFKNITRARLAASWPPDVILTRSPLAIEQLRATRFTPKNARLVLEWQYPESMQLWRGWRKKHPQASLGVAARRYGQGREQELRRIKRADGILYAAAGHRQWMERAGYTGPSAPLPSASPSAAGPVPGQPSSPEFDFGYCGGLASENGVLTLLEALAQCPGAPTLALVGRGNEKQERAVEEAIARLGLESRVQRAGWVAPGQVAGWMHRCAAGVVPLSRCQGPEKRMFASPLKLVEWCAAGVAVVASAVPSVTQLLQNEKHALLVPPDDPIALAGAMDRLRQDAALRERLAAQGRAWAAAATFEQRAARIVEFVQSLPPGQ